MLIFEISPNATDIKNDIIHCCPNCEMSSIDSLDGNDFIEILVPLVSIMMPTISQILQKYFNDNRVVIKFDGIEISALGYEKAMKILKEVLEQRNNAKNENTK